jgi:hypothetical protein
MCSVTAESPELSYAQPFPWHRRRVTKQVVYAFTALVVLLVGVYLWPVLSRVGPVLYCKRQAVAYTAPADAVVYSNDPHYVAALRARGYQTKRPFFAPGSFVIRPNPTFENLANAHAGTRTSVAPAVFLHRLESPSGHARIAAVQLSTSTFSDPFRRVFLHPHLERTGLSNAGAPATGGMEIFVYATDRITIFHGQPDPSNPTHFTIGYAINDQRGTIDGYLKDGNVLVLLPRTGQPITHDSLTRWSPTGAAMPEWLHRQAATQETEKGSDSSARPAASP